MENLIKLIKDEFDGIEKKELEEIEELDLNFDGYDYIDIDGGEYRVIPEKLIENLFHDETIELVEGSYLGNTDLPSFITSNIDWDGIVSECMMDGYGHHFNGYDGTEIYGHGFYLFRNN